MVDREKKPLDTEKIKSFGWKEEKKEVKKEIKLPHDIWEDFVFN